MAVAVVSVALGVMTVFGVLISHGGSGASLDAVPLVLSDQAAPAQVTIAPQPRQAAIPHPFEASPAWVQRIAQRSGISAIAIAAYADATLRLASEQPSCHLGWSTLAGIGTIESGNGTFGGRKLLPSGLPNAAIQGPALNGTAGNAAIPNGNGGWSSALGPMQFIGSTWQRWGADGNGDGVKDIHNIFDAAVAAGRYLCANGRDLATAHGWTAAIYSYNHDIAYVRNVYAAANAAAR